MGSGGGVPGSISLGGRGWRGAGGRGWSLIWETQLWPAFQDPQISPDKHIHYQSLLGVGGLGVYYPQDNIQLAYLNTMQKLKRGQV